MNANFRLSSFILSVVAILAIPLILDEVIFRNVYLRFIEPQSTAGVTLLTIRFLEDSYSSNMRNILIVGDSRVNEGFSPQIANEIGHAHGYHFVRLSAPGTTPRMWFYYLRKIDPECNRFQAIYLMVNQLDEYNDSFSNRSLDTQYLIPLLGLRDIYSYSQSFSDPKERERAWMSVAFPAAALRPDIIDFIKNPKERLRKVRMWKNTYTHSLESYEGRPDRLPDAQITTLTSVVNSLEPKLKDRMSAYVADVIKEKDTVLSKTNDASFAYRSHWYGAIAERYAGTSISIGVFPLPRGPYHALLGDTRDMTKPFKVFERKGLIRLVRPTLSKRLERPEYFFDSMHLNAAGRVAFSRGLAEAIIQQQN
jgi:hypothetical protein